jgi:hypothetical protein
MGEAQKKSKKQSGGKPTVLQRLRESCVFYLDENLSGCEPIQAAFAAAQIKYERHHSHLPPGVEDHVWLEFIGTRDWIALTKDKGRTHTPLEKYQIQVHKIRYFAFSSGTLNAQDMAEILTTNIERMIRFIRKQPPPFIASVGKSGINPAVSKEIRIPARSRIFFLSELI